MDGDIREIIANRNGKFLSGGDDDGIEGANISLLKGCIRPNITIDVVAPNGRELHITLNLVI